MSVITADDLEDAIRQAGEGWVIDIFGVEDSCKKLALDHIRGNLAQVRQRAQERLGANAPDLSGSSIVEEFRRHPAQIKGFFQALGRTRTPDMLLMAWRIIQGMEIKHVELSYRRQQSFRMRIILESPFGAEDVPPYESDDVNDFALLRHMGIIKMENAPVLDGFYPLRLRPS